MVTSLGLWILSGKGTSSAVSGEKAPAQTAGPRRPPEAPTKPAKAQPARRRSRTRSQAGAGAEPKTETPEKRPAAGAEAQRKETSQAMMPKWWNWQTR